MNKRTYYLNDLSITDHALHRYQQRYCPGATRKDIAEALSKGAIFVCKCKRNADLVSANGYAWIICNKGGKSVVITVLNYKRKNQEFWIKRVG